MSLRLKYVVFTIKSLAAAKFTALTPLSLQFSSELSVPIMGLNIASFLILALKSPITIFVSYDANLSVSFFIIMPYGPRGSYSCSEVS